MRFEVLGPVRVHRDGEVVAVSGTLRRGLLAMLLAAANEPVPVDVLLDALWGELPGPRAPQRLQLHVHKLRRMLDDPERRLSFGPEGYRLRVLPGELDVEQFETLVDEAGSVAAQDPQRCTELIRKALGIWRGTPYQGVDVPRLAGDIQRLSERRLMAVEELYTAELRCGRHAAITGELSDLVGEYPLRERLHGLLMTALYQGGRQADALAVYRRARDTLVDELGLEPGPELRALEGRILAGAPIEFAGAGVVPAQLPHNVSGFVGRESELSQLDGLLDEGGESALISAVAGTAGVGKTALAVRWAHRVKDRFPDGQLYVDLHGYGPDQPASSDDVLAVFLRALGMDGTAIPQDPAERAARFRTLLDRKRLLVVLDNAHSADQVRPLLPGTPTCFVVVTSRDSLAGLAAREGARRIDLDRMSLGEAHRLLAGLLGDRCHAEPEATAELIERCARLPLALRIAAERIRERPRRGIADLVTELADEHARLDLLDTGGDPHASVRAVFSSSYRHLEPRAARLFRLFGLHPGHDIDAYALTALAGDDELRVTRRLLDTLVRAHLVEEGADHRFHLHDLLATYAAELTEATDSADERRAALARLFGYYLRTASIAANLVAPHELEPPGGGDERAIPMPSLRSYEAAVWWLDVERANLVRASEAAAGWDLPGYTTDFCTVLLGYLDLGWYLDDAQQLYGNALAVARQRRDAITEGLALRGIGLLNFRLDRFEEAARYFEQALALHEGTAEVFKATTLNCFGVLCGFTGHGDDAIRHLERSAQLYRAHGQRLLTQRPLANLGLFYRRRGEFDRAHACLREALQLAEEGSHPPAQAHACYGLAGLCRDTGRYDEALGHVRQALAFARKARFHFLEGLVLNRLGTIYRLLGDDTSAQRHHHDALAIARTTANGHLEAMVLNGVGEAHATAGAFAEAARCHADALAVASARGVSFQQARAHTGLGDAHDRLGEPAKAGEHWRRALEIYHGLRAPEAAGIREKLAWSG